MEGTIQRVMYDRNYGFIDLEGQERGLFFHRSQVTGDFDALKEGDKVKFEIEETDRGQQATNVELI